MSSSTGQSSRHKSQSATSKKSDTSRLQAAPPAPTLTPESDRELQPCAATGSYFLYAQRNVVICLHHDTLAIERRMTKHIEDVLWISVDTISDRGAGRLAVSYDAGNTAIIWDIHTGQEVARFAAYEQIRVAVWMRNGNIAFGRLYPGTRHCTVLISAQAIPRATSSSSSPRHQNIFLLERSSILSPHLPLEQIAALLLLGKRSSRRCIRSQLTICSFSNGSILIATLTPAFTILHSLTTSRGPSRVTGLAWHGSSSRSKTEMLAAQTADGDLRVWSVPKTHHNGESPSVIRILNKHEGPQAGPCWFAWSKNGRILQHSDR